MTIAAGSGVSQLSDPVQATEAACAHAQAAAGDAAADLAFVFFSAEHAEAASDIAGTVHKALSPYALIGCSAQGIVAGDREFESGPAVAVWIARLGNSSLMTFAADFDPETHAFTGIPDGGSSAILLADPFTFPADHLLRSWNEERPGFSVIGGMASAAGRPGGNRLIVDRDVYRSGAAGVLIDGAVRIRPLVSQGCRPVGEPGTVTRAEGNVILELAGRPPIERVRETFAGASPEERQLMQGGLHLGRVIDEYKSEFHRGDFLIRGVLGADPETGAVAVGDHIGVGETVQFHVRDAVSADEDLRELLASQQTPGAALLFTCNGRGLNLFPEPHHDARAIRSAFGDVPLAGFFAAGELGPVGGANFMHGFTASMALFVEE